MYFFDPAYLYVPTGLQVSPGEIYRFEAQGLWKDWWRICGPEGWSAWPLQWGNRVPGLPFFYLCGAIGTSDRLAFPIGARREWTVPAPAAGEKDRQLYLFANDWRHFYGNNRRVAPEEGRPLTVTINRL